MTKLEKPSGSNLLINTAAFMIVVAGLHAASSLVVRLLLALFISFICWPLFFFLDRKGVPKAISIIAVLLMITGAGFFVGVLIGTSVNDFTETWPIYQANFNQMINSTLSYLSARGIEVPRETILDVLNPGTIMNVVGGIFSTLTGMLNDTMLILITVIFILLEASGVPAKVTAVWGHNSRAMRELERFAWVMQRYITLKTLISFATGLLIAVGLMIVGIDFALLWGLLAFLLNYVPTIGSIIASIPATLLALIQYGWLEGSIVGAIYLAVNMAIGNIIEPRTMGRGLGLSTLIVFVSLVFWGWVLGPVGMLLSVPLTMSVKLYLESRDSTRWMAILLGRGMPKEKAAPAKEPS